MRVKQKNQWGPATLALLVQILSIDDRMACHNELV